VGTVLSVGIALEPKKFIIPFCVPSENRKEPFTPDLEVAAVFSLAELDRAKGGGLIVKQPEEKTVFISKISYPLWIIPWSEVALIFDGLNKANHSFPYAAVPEVKPFMDDLKRGSKTREPHLAFLRDHINYFQNIPIEKRLTINGLIGNPDFLSEFDSCRRQATRTEDTSAHAALLAPVIDESIISSEVHEVESLHSSFQQDVENLNKCMKFLNKAAHHYIRELHGMARAVKEEFYLKIKVEEGLVAPKVDELKDEYDARVTELTKHYENQRLPIQKEIVKLEKNKERAQGKIEQYKQEAKSQAENDKPAVEKKWKEKINETKKEIYQIEDQLKQTADALKNLEERKALESFKLKDELETKVKEAMKNLLELEASRDAKILIHKQEKERLEKKTQQIIDQINKAIKLREADVAQFAKLGVERELGSEGNALFYVPFYVICYQADQKKRYSILPPSAATTVGLTAKLRGVLGGARIKELLASRFKSFSSLTDTMQALIQQNAAFEAEIKELGANANILNSSASNAEIKKGLAYLKSEGWLSEKEYDAISQKIT
jgi:hypothetical protein